MTTVDLSCAGCDKPMRKTRTSKQQGEAYCNPCRNAGKALKHGTAYAYRKGCRCEACRAEQNRILREYSARVKARDGASPTAQIKRKRRGIDPTETVTCIVCGDALSRVRSERHIAPTHTLCKTNRSFYVHPDVRQSVFERDEWTCTICNHPVDPDAHYLTDWYPTLDHVIPQSHQLIPDHSPDALRLAHRYCNLARGDRLTTDQDVARRASERRLATV